MRDRLFNFETTCAGLRATSAQTIIFAARAAVLIFGALAVACYRNSHLADIDVVLINLVLGVSLLVAYPRHRVTDLTAAFAIWLTAFEAMSGWQTGQFDLRRWLVALATLGVILLLRRIQDFRAIARQNPARPLAESERRGRGGRAKAVHGNAQTEPGVVEIDGFCRIV